MNLIRIKIEQLVFVLFIIFQFSSVLADMNEGCKSCVKGYDCSRINKVCNATCAANLYSKNIDLESCRAKCIGKLEKCLLEANKSCSFYCEDK
ncbi:hypothetical protein MNBD_GAMMA07-1673 [hydrothermal vent metagenome]|uniref:Uncharacterized protein n=1 Tax=hydrothermal vent metagenome TaxID=652676 RepID=A0A3B0WYC2_9ZZZZ